MASYREVTVTGRRVYDLDRGEDLTDILFDCTHEDAYLEIKCRHGDNLIKNIGVKGWQAPDSGGFFGHVLADEGETVTFDNVYCRGAPWDGHTMGGILVYQQHAGHLNIRNFNVGYMADNGVYGAGPGRFDRNGLGGTVRIENSYAKDCTSGSFRLDMKSEALGCTAVSDDAANRPSYASGPGTMSRHLWGMQQGGIFRDCHSYRAPDGSGDPVTSADHWDRDGYFSDGRTDFYNCQGNGRIYNGDWMTFTNSDLSNGDPDTRVPCGCPTSPEMAASGGGATENCRVTIVSDQPAEDTTEPDEDTYDEPEPAPAPDPTPLEHGGITFDRRVNGVDDLGMDPTGERLNDGKIRQALSQDGTLLELPPGTYKVGANSDGHVPRVNVNANRVGIIGTGDSRDDVRIVTEKGRYSRWLSWTGRDFLFKNLVWDQYEDFDTLIGHHITPTGGRFAVVGCGLVGTETTQGSVSNVSSGRDPMMFSISNRGGHIRIKNWVDLTPTRFDDYPQNRSIWWVGMGATGSMHVSDLWVRHGSGSVFYTGKDKMSPITFEDCHFEHCHDKCIRATGANTTIKNCTFWWDDRKWDDRTHVTGGRRAPNRASARAIWAQTNSRSQRPGPTIENCHFKVDHTRWGGGEVVWNRYAGAGTVKNCRFERHTGGAAVIAGSGSGAVHVHDCHFTGSSGRATAGGRIHAHGNCDSLSGGSSTCSKPVLPDQFPGAGEVGDIDGGAGGGGTVSWNTLVISGSNADTPTNYQFSVSGDLRGRDIDSDHDAVEGQNASGRVANYRDIYEFTGGLVSWSSSEDSALTVTVNGSEVDPNALVDIDREPNPFDPNAEGNYNVDFADYRGGAVDTDE